MSLSTVLAQNDGLAVRLLVADTAGNVRYFPSTAGVSGIVSAAQTVVEVINGRLVVVALRPLVGGLEPTLDGDGIIMTEGTPVQITYPQTVAFRRSDDAAGFARTQVITAPNQELAPTSPGVYTITTASGETFVREITENLAVTTFTRTITATLPSYTIDLSTIGPAEEGTATYTIVESPLPGSTLVGSSATVFPVDAFVGDYIWRRSDDNGLRDLVLTLTTVPMTISEPVDGVVTITQGADDPVDMPLQATVSPEGPYANEVYNWTIGDLSPSADYRALPPVIQINSGADGAAVNVGGVVSVARDSLRLRLGGAPAAVTGQWFDGAGAIPGATNPAGLTITGDMVVSVRWVEDPGGTNASSNSISISGTSDDLEILTARTYHQTTLTATPTFTVDTSGLLTGDVLLVGMVSSVALANQAVAPAATVGAGTLSPLDVQVVGGNNQNHRRMALYSHTMAAPASTLDFGFTLNAADNNRTVIVVPIRNGVIGTPVGAMDDGAGSATQAITPASEPNRIVAMHGRADEAFAEWFGVDPLTRSPAVTRGQVGVAIDATAGTPLTVTASGTGSGRSVLALIPITPAP